MGVLLDRNYDSELAVGAAQLKMPTHYGRLPLSSVMRWLSGAGESEDKSDRVAAVRATGEFLTVEFFRDRPGNSGSVIPPRLVPLLKGIFLEEEATRPTPKI